MNDRLIIQLEPAAGERIAQVLFELAPFLSVAVEIEPISMASVFDCGPKRKVLRRITEPSGAPSKSRASLLTLSANSNSESSMVIKVFCHSVS